MYNNIHKLYMESVQIVDSGLKQYIEENVIPEYKEAEPHRIHHIRSGMEYAIKYAEMLDLDINIAYTMVAYHDVGLRTGERKGHAKRSKEYVLNDKGLRQFFTEKEINIIANAVGRHSSSEGDKVTKDDYTKYDLLMQDVDEADKVKFEDIVLLTYRNTRHVHPTIDKEELEDKMVYWIDYRIDEGYIFDYNFDIIQKDKQEDIERTKRITKDKERVREEIRKVIQEQEG